MMLALRCSIASGNHPAPLAATLKELTKARNAVRAALVVYNGNGGMTMTNSWNAIENLSALMSGDA